MPSSRALLALLQGSWPKRVTAPVRVVLRHSNRRAYQTDAYAPGALPPVRFFGPTIWALTAAGSLYLGCAAYDVRRDAMNIKNERLRPISVHSPMTYDEMEAVKAYGRGLQQAPSQGGALPSSPLAMLQHMSPTGKLMASGVALNSGILVACSAIPGAFQYFSHMPAGPSNYTLFTSMFGHAGLLHLGLNMYALLNFTPPVVRSRTFDKSASHLAAFYLSSGILASLGSHLTSAMLPWKPWRRVSPGLGASGAIMALLGAFAFSYPDAQIGIILIPGSLPALQALAGLVLFDAYGFFVGFKSLRLGHATHLTGLGIGSAYVYFDGKKRVWQPTRRLAFNLMRRLDMV